MEERKRVRCCDKAAFHGIEELDNSQNADPGWRHVRANFWVSNLIGGARIRFCPFCGEAYRSKPRRWITKHPIVKATRRLVDLASRNGWSQNALIDLIKDSFAKKVREEHEQETQGR